MRIMRSVGSVAAGLVATMVLVMALTWLFVQLMFDGDMTASPTPAYLAINLTYSFGAAVVGGWIAARLAADRPLLHAGLLAAVLLLISLVGGGPPEAGVPGWYGPAVALLGAAGAVSGGALRQRSRRSPRSVGAS